MSQETRQVKLEVPQILNYYFNNLTRKLAEKKPNDPDAKMKRASDNYSPASLIVRGAGASQIIHQYFMVEDSRTEHIKHPSQKIIKFPPHACDEESFFREIWDGIEKSGKFNENTTAAELAKSFTEASNTKGSFVLIIPNLDALSPKILDFIYEVLKTQVVAVASSMISLNVTLVMGLDQTVSNPYLQRIVEQHSNITVSTLGDLQKFVYMTDINLGVNSTMTPQREVILSIISLFGQKIPLDYLSAIFRETKTFQLNQTEIVIKPEHFKEEFEFLTKASPKLVSERNIRGETYCELKAPHHRDAFLQSIEKITCEGQSLADMLLRDHRPNEKALLGVLLEYSQSAVTQNVGITEDDEFYALINSLEHYIANYDYKNINPTIERLIKIVENSDLFSEDYRLKFVQYLKSMRVPSQQFLEQLTKQQKLVLSIAALLGHNRIPVNTLTSLFANGLSIDFYGDRVTINPIEFKTIFAELSADSLFISTQNDKAYFPSPEFQQRFASMATKDLIEALLNEPTLQSNEDFLVELLLLKEKITEESHVKLLVKKFDALVKSEKHEQANLIAVILTKDKQIVEKLDKPTLLALWKNRVTCRAKNGNEDINLQAEVLKFIDDFFAEMNKSDKFKFLKIFLSAVSSTSLRLFSVPLGHRIYQEAQKISHPGLQLDSVKWRASYGEHVTDAQREMLISQQRQAVHSQWKKLTPKKIAENLRTLDEQYDNILQSQDTDTYGGYILSLVKRNESFNKFFTDNGINPKEHQKFFVLRLLKLSKHSAEEQLPEDKKPAFKEQVLVKENLEELLSCLDEMAFYKELTTRLYLSNDTTHALILGLKSLQRVLADQIYASDTCYFAVSYLFLSRVVFSNEPEFVMPLYYLLADKMGRARGEEASAARIETVERDPAVAADPMIKFIFCLVTSRLFAFSESDSRMLREAAAESLKRGDVLAYLTCVFTEIKVGVQSDHESRHYMHATLINRAMRTILDKYPAQKISALYLLPTIWADQIWLGEDNDGHPYIPPEVLNELFSYYENEIARASNGQRGLMDVVGPFLTPQEKKVYEEAKATFPNWSKVAGILAASNSTLGLADYYLNRMWACLAENTNESIANGINAARVFIERGLISGLKGRLSEPAAITAILLLVKAHYIDSKIESVFKKFIDPSAWVNKVKNTGAGANVFYTTAKHQVKLTAKNLPGIVYYPIAKLVDLALQPRNEGKVLRLFKQILADISAEEPKLTPNAEVLTALTLAIEWVPDRERIELASKILTLVRENKVASLERSIMAKYPQADKFYQKVESDKSAIQQQRFQFPRDIEIDDVVRSVYTLCQAPHQSEDYTLPQAALVLLSEILSRIGINIHEINVPIHVVKRVNSEWFVCNLQRAFDNKTLHFKAISPNKLPVKFLASAAPYSVREINYPSYFANDEWFNPFRTTPYETVTSADLGGGYSAIFHNHRCYDDVQVLNQLKRDKAAELAASGVSQEEIEQTVKNVVLPQRENTDIMGDPRLPNMREKVPECYFAVLFQLLEASFTNHIQLNVDNIPTSSVAVVSSAGSGGVFMTNYNDMSVLDIPDSLKDLEQYDFTENFEPVFLRLEELELAIRDYDISGPRKNIAIQRLNQFNSPEIQDLLNNKKTTQEVKNTVFNNLQLLFDHAISSVYVSGIDPNNENLIGNILKLAKSASGEMRHSLRLFVNQARFHQAMQLHETETINLELIRQEAAELTIPGIDQKDLSFYLAASYALALLSESSSRDRAVKIIDTVREGFIKRELVSINDKDRQILLDDKILSSDKRIQHALSNVADKVSKHFGNKHGAKKQNLPTQAQQQKIARLAGVQ